MRRRGKNNRTDIIIDLTSLLDVIFIILLVVLCSQKNISDKMQETEKDRQQAVLEAEAKAELYESQLETADSLNQYVWAASVAVPYDSSDITKRQIMLLKEDREIGTYEMSGNAVDGALSALKSDLAKYAEENEGHPVILSLNEDDDKILYRDEAAVSRIFDELKSSYDNVYIKGNISGDTE